MLNTISPRQRINVVSYALAFRLYGYAFDCDENGRLLPFLLDNEVNRCAMFNYLRCEVRAAKEGYTPYVEKYEHSYTQPAVRECECCGEFAVYGAAKLLFIMA